MANRYLGGKCFTCRIRFLWESESEGESESNGSAGLMVLMCLAHQEGSSTGKCRDEGLGHTLGAGGSQA
jgi:hypothetical protein